MEDEKREKIVEKYGVDIRDLKIANVKKWVRALRSGKYKKTEGQLFDGDNAFCALGVAAKEAGVNENELRGEYSLPSKAMMWLGVDDDIPSVGHQSVVDLNDRSESVSFKQIARRIETCWIKPYEKYKHCFLGKKGRTK